MKNILELYEVLLGIEESIDYQDDVIETTKDDFINRYKIQQSMIDIYNFFT